MGNVRESLNQGAFAVVARPRTRVVRCRKQLTNCMPRQGGIRVHLSQGHTKGDVMPKKKSGKKVGSWKIKRVGENQLTITIPSGMAIRKDAQVTVEDLLSGIANYMAAKRGLDVTCCSASVMVA
jgi:hypothetical protein